MPRVEVDPDALDDLDAIYDYIGRARRSLRIADQVLDRIHQTHEIYSTRPGMGEPRPDLGPGLRFLAVGSHVVIYRALEDGIRVLRVFEGHRNYPALFRKGV